ncbi:MAG: hypothetical protein LC792_23250 [Actinobacteria bacterium]|nr:hypothetical protein [Actinomycetota bacterium]
MRVWALSIRSPAKRAARPASRLATYSACRLIRCPVVGSGAITYGARAWYQASVSETAQMHSTRRPASSSA